MDRVSGFVVFALGILIFWQGSRLPVGNLHMPGPGFFPSLLGAGLMILSWFLIIPIGKKEWSERSFSTKYVIRALPFYAAMVVYFFVLEYLGFVLASFLLMSYFFLAAGYRKWYVAVVLAFISTALAYILFEVLLESNLPKGVLGS